MVLHYTFGSSENGTSIKLHAQDAVGLYNSVTGETFGLYSFGAPYTVSTATGDPFAGQAAEVLDTTGQVSGVTSLERQQDGTYTTNSNPAPGESYICFTSGTLIMTVYGERAVEDLRMGDTIVTKDGGLQQIRWIGARNFAKLHPTQQHLQPITIKAHAFGENIPKRDTQISPNHAILNAHWRNTLHFGDAEVLTLAKTLQHSDHVYTANRTEVTYHHILLDTHELILANGMWSESLFLGDESMDMLGERSRAEVFEVFPELQGDLSNYGVKARQVIRAKDAVLLK